MATIYSPLFSPNIIPPHLPKPITKLTAFYSPCSPTQYQRLNKRRDFSLPAVASVSFPEPMNVDYLESEFSGHGVTFDSIGNCCVVRMALENGSVASLMLPSGLVTSYKALMWHGGLVELLHTSVSEGLDGSPVIQGGVSLAFKCSTEGEKSWSPTYWTLHNVKGSSDEFIEVELMSRNLKDRVELKHIVTLKPDVLSSEVVVSNSSPSSSLQLMGSVLSHLTVSTPEATYAVGLGGSDFFSRPPILSDFSLIPPDFSEKKNLSSSKIWDPTNIKEIFAGWKARDQRNAGYHSKSLSEEVEELEGEEEDDYKHLTEKMSRIYTSAPRYFTVIDRGRRNSIVVGREGFNELYMFSPGSSHKWYGKFAYVCIGQSALLEPINLLPDGEWRGVQHIHNPNM